MNLKSHARLLFFVFFAVLLFNAAAIGGDQFSDKILAVVNGEVITQSDVDQILSPIYQQYSSNYTGEELSKRLQQARDDILSQLIEDKLLLQQAKQENLEVDESELDRIMDGLRDNFPSEEEFETALKEQGMARSEIRERYREQLLIKKIVQREILRKISITPSQVAEYYQAHKQEFQVEPQVHLRSIFIDGKDKKSEKKIQEVHSQLKEGKPFVEMVEKYSEAQNVVDSGDMGYVEKGSMRREIEEALLDLNPGEITDPIGTPGGYYIFKVEGRKDSEVLPLEQVQDRIQKFLYQQEAKTKLQEWVNKLKSSAFIEEKTNEKET